MPLMYIKREFNQKREPHSAYYDAIRQSHVGLGVVCVSTAFENGVSY